jgi:RHS repeat-associated protein
MPPESYVASTTCTSDFCCNQQYSVTAITTAAGAIAERYAYTAYGLPTILNASATIIATSAISNRYTYTGREWDATLGLHHFRARWMSPTAGRFLGRDPIGYRGSPGNLYQYCRNSPAIFIDFSGLACHICTKLDSVAELKDSNGDIIGCGLIYVFNEDKPTRTYNGKSCPKECEPVSDCASLGDLTGKKFTKLVLPSYKGWLGSRTPYCPPKSDLDQDYCFGINSQKCKGDWEKEFKDCEDLCANGDYVRYLCEGIRVPGLKQLCKAFVSGSTSNCRYYCENSKLKMQ